jgi:hypothetical protein
MINWATLSEREKVSKLLWEFRNFDAFDTEIFSKRRKIYSICVEGNGRNGRNGNKQPNFRSSFGLRSNLTTFAFFAVSKLDTHCRASNYNIQPYMPCLQTSDLHSA